MSKNSKNLSRRKKTQTFKDKLPRLMAALPDSPEALICLYDAYRAAVDALVGIANQPRVERCEAAGNAIDDEVERISDLYCAVFEKLSRIRSINETDKPSYIQVMVGHALICGEGPREIAFALASASAVQVVTRENLAA
jgi:hypothetical protein